MRADARSSSSYVTARSPSTTATAWGVRSAGAGVAGPARRSNLSRPCALDSCHPRGTTTLVVSLPGSERLYAARGRETLLLDFAEALRALAGYLALLRGDLAAAAEAKLSLSAMAASYRLPVALSDRLENFPVETSARLMAYLRGGDENLAAFLAPIGKPASVSDIDGLRVTLDDGRIIHFRPSGNAPEMRCYVEADTVEAAERLLSTGLSTIRHWAKTASN